MHKSILLFTIFFIAALIGMTASEGVCQTICGDANGDETVNVSDAVYIINYVFVGGPIPEPLASADANCDGSVNVSDAVYIINFVFVGGNDPCDTDNDGQPNCDPDAEMLVDIDGNVYQTVQIGDQIWMAENLKVTHYRNGDPIPYVTGAGSDEGAYANYNDDEGNVSTYGRLYNWYAVDDSRGLAPEGWHIPSEFECAQLEIYLGDNAGGKLKEAGTAHWLSPNTGATNETGFTALPGGYRTYLGAYQEMGWGGLFWTSTEYSGDGSTVRVLYNTSSEFISYATYKSGFCSIRCVRDENITSPEVVTYAASNITQTTADCGGEVISDGGAPIFERGICFSEDPDPTLEDSTTVEGSGLGSFTSSYEYLVPNTTYYFRAYATNTVFTGYGDVVSFTTLESETGTVTDIDGNIYTTVKIGDQWWMAENLKVQHYNNGDTLFFVDNEINWYNYCDPDSSIGANCVYENNMSYIDTYGKLYNKWSALDSRGLAPEGWHVPDAGEYLILKEFLNDNAGKLKDTTSLWNSPNVGATNETGFTALPGGFVYQSLFFGGMDSEGNFLILPALNMVLQNSISDFFERSLEDRDGASIRSVKDTTPVVTTNPVVSVRDSSAQCNGVVITESGPSATARGVCWSTSPNPTTSNNTTSDGTGSGGFTSTLTNLTPNMTYYVKAYAINSLGTAYGEEREFTTCELFGSVSDYDGNVYETVKIGDQWWMRTNLKVTHYRNGDPIPNVTDDGAWEALLSGAYCELENDPSNVDIYGRLYNWYAVEDSRNVAPVGWHVPTDEEWKQMEMELGMSQAEADDTLCRGFFFYENDTWYGPGSMLKEFGTTHWYCYPEYNEDAIDNVGFTALPGGVRDPNGLYGIYGFFWTATMNGGDKAWLRLLPCTQGCVVRWARDKRMGMSVRCVKD